MAKLTDITPKQWRCANASSMCPAVLAASSVKLVIIGKRCSHSDVVQRVGPDEAAIEVDRDMIKLALTGDHKMECVKEIPPDNVGEWGWYASADAEFYMYGPEDTREAIIQVAKNVRLGETEHESGDWRLSFTIARCQQRYIDVASFFDVSDFLERIDDQLSDSISDQFDDLSPLEPITTDAAKELQVLVRNAIREWQHRHGYEMHVNTFENITDEERITIDLPVETESEAL